jgi:hypothetical protein
MKLYPVALREGNELANKFAGTTLGKPDPTSTLHGMYEGIDGGGSKRISPYQEGL